MMLRWYAPCLVCALLLWCAPLAYSQSSVCAAQGKGLDPVAFETMTVSTTVLGLTAGTINTTTAAAVYITLETGASLRYTLFGTPSATVGHLIDPPSTGNAGTGSGIWFCGRAALTGLRFIRAGGTDAVIRITYYRQR